MLPILKGLFANLPKGSLSPADFITHPTGALVDFAIASAHF
jgi:hypothetical protein